MHCNSFVLYDFLLSMKKEVRIPGYKSRLNKVKQVSNAQLGVEYQAT
jgi:hypothetical protein